jgi:hypothetical protein
MLIPNSKFREELALDSGYLGKITLLLCWLRVLRLLFCRKRLTRTEEETSFPLKLPPLRA